MNDMFAQGDLLIERVADIEPSGILVERDAKGIPVAAGTWKRLVAAAEGVGVKAPR